MVYLAYRTLSHMAKTLVYSADPVTMEQKRGDIATILEWGKNLTKDTVKADLISGLTVLHAGTPREHPGRPDLAGKP